jgi:hypothetical protein
MRAAKTEVSLAMLAPLLALSLAAAGDRAMSEAPGFATLQGGETLGVGNTEAVFAAGYSTLSASWAQGLSDAADYGAVLDFDWTTSELLLGGLYRTLLWRSGAASVALRARGGLYADFGATWAASANRSDAGLQAAPGVALALRSARGVLSIAADLPLTLTFSRGGGYAAGLRGSIAFETPLWGDLLAGARAGVGGTWSGSGAPFARDSPRATLDLAALLTYRLF